MDNSKPKYGSGRQRIMEAATEIVLHEGLRGLTFRAVGEQAGVSNSLIVHHFGTRQNLLEETLMWTLEESIGLTQLPLFVNDPEAYVTAFFDLLTAEMPVVVFQYQMILESQRKPMIREPVRMLYEQYVDELVGIIQLSTATKIDEDSGRFIFATLDGLMLQYVAGVERERVESSLLAFWNCLFASFGQRPRKTPMLYLKFPELAIETAPSRT